MKLYSTFGVHFALFVETERLLRLAEQLGFIRVVLLKRQTATIQVLERQFPGFFRSVRP